MSIVEKQVSLILKQALEKEVASSISFYMGSANSDIVFQHAGISNRDTIYDLASLTKIIGTTLALAKASSEGLIDLNERPFPSWPKISIKQLLAHKSGLLAHEKFYLLPEISRNYHKNKQIIITELFKTKAINLNISRVYSDLNFMALGILLESRLKKSLYDILVDSWNCFGLEHEFKFFNSSRANLDPKIAPTGICKLRKVRLRGLVHDLNCFAMGGIAGHAGLFGNLSSVAAYGRLLLKCYQSPESAHEEMLASFIKNNLGFDRPTKNGSVRHLSPTSFGHFGFTGTSLWIDPQAREKTGLIFVLLTNRVDKSLDTEPIFWLREQLHKLS